MQFYVTAVISAHVIPVTDGTEKTDYKSYVRFCFSYLNTFDLQRF